MGSRFFGPAIDLGFSSETAIQEVLPTGLPDQFPRQH